MKCYEIIGSQNEKFAMSVNAAKKFIPDTLGVQISVIDKSLSPTNEHHIKFYVRESDSSCDSGLLIPNFIKKHTKNVHISITVFWGSHIIIENFEIILYQKFPRQLHDNVPGETNTLRIFLVFSRDVYAFPRYSHSDIKWTDQISIQEDSSQLCVRFFDHKGDYLFNIDIQSPIPAAIDRYNAISFYSYHDEEKTMRAHYKKYLVEMYKCSEGVDLPRMGLLVDDSIKTIVVKIGWRIDAKIYQMEFVKKGKMFYQMTSEEYSPNLIYTRVSIMSFESAWNHRLTHFLLYHTKERHLRCKGHHSGSYLDVVVYRGKSYVLRSHFLDHDELLKIKLYRRGTQLEVEECLYATNSLKFE